MTEYTALLERRTAYIVIRHDRPQFTEFTSQEDISLNSISLNDISLSDISLSDVSHNTFRRFQIECINNTMHKISQNIYSIVCQRYKQKEHIILINKGQVDQGKLVLLKLVLGKNNAPTRMWSTVYLECCVLDSMLEKSKGE